jgi:hypothetical protein
MIYHRGKMSPKERAVRSRLTKLVHNSGIIRGTLMKAGRICGRKGCRCSKGLKHISSYISQSKEGKTNWVYVPQRLEEIARQWIKNYREARELLETLSSECLRRLSKEKKQRR